MTEEIFFIDELFLEGIAVAIAGKLAEIISQKAFIVAKVLNLNMLYIQLIKQLGNSSVIYSSLNYDLLFEQSAIESGFGITYSDVPKKQMLRLLKFHGSSNFWPDMGGTVLKGCQIFGSGIADIQAPIKAFGQQETLNKCRTEDSLSPAIAMFAVGKKVKISPDFVENNEYQHN